MTNLTDIILVFVGGGILCVIAQLLIDLTRLTPARILVLYVTLGVLLYGIGLFEPMKEIFGTGVTLPLIGFGANNAGLNSVFDTMNDALFAVSSTVIAMIPLSAYLFVSGKREHNKGNKTETQNQTVTC